MDIGWIDFTEEERRNTLSVLSALKEPTAVDEIGIGVVRDAFADQFFPGTSTLLRRTKYFFLVAYALAGMEQKGGQGKSGPALRHDYNDIERKIAIELLDKDSSWGVIGQRALRSGRWVERGPGEIYWAPLRRYGMFLHPSISYAGYFAFLSGLPSQKKNDVRDEKAGNSDDHLPPNTLWNFPKESWQEWRDNIDPHLTNEEAKFLKDQILRECPQSLMAEIMRNEALRQKALQIYDSSRETDENTNQNRIDEDASMAADSVFINFFESSQDLLRENEYLFEQCRVAAMFSKFVCACRIRYNYQIPDSREQAVELWKSFKKTAYATAHEIDIEDVYRYSGYFGEISATGELRRFLLNAKKYLMQGDKGLKDLDELIRLREKSIKRNKAKIGRTDLEDISWRGGSYLPYRFMNGVRIIAEINEAGGFDA